jgi:hypothetical protein
MTSDHTSKLTLIPAPAPQFARSALLFVVVTALAFAPMACGSLNCQDPKNAGSVACTIENDIVDCTGISSLSSAVTVATPIVEKLFGAARQPDGTLKWSSSIEQQLIGVALQYGMCAVAEVWHQLMSPSSTAGSGSALVVRSAPAAAPFIEEFNRIRARVAPGHQFKTSRGTL